MVLGMRTAKQTWPFIGVAATRQARGRGGEEANVSKSSVEQKLCVRSGWLLIFKLEWWSLHYLSSDQPLWCLAISCGIFKHTCPLRNSTWFASMKVAYTFTCWRNAFCEPSFIPKNTNQKKASLLFEDFLFIPSVGPLLGPGNHRLCPLRASSCLHAPRLLVLIWVYLPKLLCCEKLWLKRTQSSKSL